MYVGVAEYNCDLMEFKEVTSIGPYDVPNVGSDYDLFLFESSSDYFSAVEGCTFTYSLELADESEAPDYYSIDSATGVIKFTNQAGHLADDQIVVVVSATDGVDPRILPYEYPTSKNSLPITVQSICGPESTVVNTPDGLRPQQAKNAGTELVIEAVFTSSNEKCPVEANELSAAVVEDFYFTDNGADGFTVTLVRDVADDLGDN
jgi:hypothetical protein